ncbi:MAG: hypothetical protein QG656_2337 [Candidatus Hydrogenedentes bacterium]|nr:hypothetical protein [Candidatus Hydrogenedentota bacterium]
MRQRAFQTIAIGLTMAWCAASPAELRILVAGDCWMYYQDQWGAFNEWLQDNGYAYCQTKGNLTASQTGLEAVTAASGAAIIQPANMTFLDAVDQELNDNPSIDIVHLSLGGDDFVFPMIYSGISWPFFSPEDVALAVDTFTNAYRTVLRHIVDNHPNVKVAVSSYVYLDPELMFLSMSWRPPGMTQTDLNYWMAWFMGLARDVTAEVDRADFVNNWGLFQHLYGIPGQYAPLELPAPGQRFDFTPYLGGDSTLGEPAYTAPGGEELYWNADGHHPSHLGHKLMFENCMNQFYDAWLTDVTPPSVVSIERAAGAQNPTGSLEVDYIVTFDEEVRKPDVTVDRFALTTAPLKGPSDAVIVSVAGGGDTYVVTVSTGTQPADIRLDLADPNGIRDIAYHAVSAAFTSGDSYVYLGPDTDGDGLFDNEEAALGTDPNEVDTDDDGLSDFDEVDGLFGFLTDPLLRDTDWDGSSDGDEVMLGSDPTDPSSSLDTGGWAGMAVTALLLGLAGVFLVRRRRMQCV